MCSCTHDSPFECEARMGRDRCTCACHRPMPVPVVPHEPLTERDAEIQRLRNTLAAVRGTLIGAWASGEVDGPDGSSYCKRVLAQIANDVSIQPAKEKASE